MKMPSLTAVNFTLDAMRHKGCAYSWEIGTKRFYPRSPILAHSLPRGAAA